METAAVAPGLYEVNVDFSGYGPATNVSLFDEFDDELMNLGSLELFPLLPSSQEACALTIDGCDATVLPAPVPVPEYFLYLITPRGQASEYVLRLPYFLSDMCFLGLESVSFTTVPTWYTFSNMQSVVCITFSTNAAPAQIAESLKQVASWADTVQSWVTTYKNLLPASASPNLASVLCTTSSILVCDAEREDPVWLQHDTPLFQHTVTVMPPPALAVPPEWVTHVCGQLNAYSLHSRLSNVHRHHVELRRPSPCLFPPLPPPPALSNNLVVGDYVMYLRPALDACVCTTVRHVGSDRIELESGDTPAYVAKFDSVQQTLLSDLQPLASFLVV